MSIIIKNQAYTYLKKTPNEVIALDDVNLEIKDGSFTTILGHTGCGKSTLIQCLNGLIIPDEGTIEIAGYVLNNKKKNKNIKKIRKKVALVFQFPEYQLFEETVEKDVAFGPSNYGLKEAEAFKLAHKYLNLVGIDESYYKRSPFELSGGEKRRVAIAGILALEPEILVLDEPTVGLDPNGVEQIMGLVDKLHQEGKTIIVVTHDMNIVEKYATDVVVMKQGKIIFEGTPKKLFTQDLSDYAIEETKLSQFVNKLIASGLNINRDKIKDIPSLISEIKEVKKHG